MEPTSSGGPTSPAADCDCRGVLFLLERCEADPAFGRRDAETLRAHLARCEPCDHRHGRRLAAAIGFVSLHERRVPTGLLDDLYVAVHARAPYAPLAGGMSETFLDGPRSLRVWRSAAVAAVLLLAVGATWTMSNGLPSSRAATPVPLTDVRNELLLDYDVSPAAEPYDSRFTTVSWPQHRTGRSFSWGSSALRPRPSAPEATSPRRD